MASKYSHVWTITALIVLATSLTFPSTLDAAEGQDVVILKDGRKKVGKIEKETASAVFLEIEPGEVLPIGKERIKKIVRSGEHNTDPRAPQSSRIGRKVKEPDPLAAAVKAAQQGEAKRIYEALEDLGHSHRDRRKAALKRALDEGFRAVPILLAMFHPQQNASAELQIGALRALAQLGPLDNQAAQTLGWIAMKAKNREVHREACRTIRFLKEDRALQYVLQFSISKDRATQVAAARALREINDDRAFASLAVSIPQPTMNANVPESATDIREIPDMPLGGSLRGPLFLPSREVQGTAENIMSPQAETLTMIAGKKLGGLPAVWVNWINEKAGTWTRQEREDAYRDRKGSLINRMGSPQAQGGQ